MKGLLTVNPFIRSEGFTELYRSFQNAAAEQKIPLEVKTTAELPHNLAALRALSYDFILFWDKDVLLAEMLEACGFRVFNSARAIALCDHKGKTALCLEQAGVPIPETYSAPLTYEGVGYNDLSFLAAAAEKLGYPLILKEFCGSFGRQVYLACDEREAREIVQRIGWKGFLAQKFIESSRGTDLRFGIVGGEIAYCVRRNAEGGDFRSNIGAGGHMERFEPTAAQREAALAAFRAVGADFAGVDVLFGPGGAPLVCEVNSNLHFRAARACTGVDLSRRILQYVAEKTAAGKP